MDAFGPTLDYFCKRQGIRIQDLAEQMGVSRNTLTNWKAKGKPPTSEVTVKLATILYLDERETDSLLLSAGYAPKYSVKESNATFPNKTQQIATNSLENSIRVIVAQTTEQASGWLEVVRETIFDKGREISEGKLRNTLYLDEREQRRHLGLALKNAIEGGLAMFHTTEEREQYRQVLGILSELGAHSDALRRDVLKSFMLSETPDLTEFNAIYSRSIRIHTVANKKPRPVKLLAPSEPFKQQAFESEHRR